MFNVLKICQRRTICENFCTHTFKVHVYIYHIMRVFKFEFTSVLHKIILYVLGIEIFLIFVLIVSVSGHCL